MKKGGALIKFSFKPFIEKQKLQHYLHKRQVKTVVGNQANWGPNIRIALMYPGMRVYEISIMSSSSRSSSSVICRS